MRWISVAVVGAVMVSAFFLAGGFGSSPSTAALAGSADAPSATSPRVISISLNACADTTLSGSVGVADKFTGNLTLGLFALEPSPQHLTRQFIDSGLRASATFDNGANASFTFSSLPGGAPAYEVVILPSSGKITSKTALIESQAMPPCGTRRVTETATTTQTVTVGAAVTGTGDVTISVPSYQTVTVRTGTGTESAVTLTTSILSTRTVVTTVSNYTLITSTVFTTAS
jgi:hypothetical protein